MPTHPRIARNPDILSGKPAVAGTRIAVEFVLERLAAGWSEAEVLENYPQLSRDDVLACLAYARDLVEESAPAHAAE